MLFFNKNILKNVSEKSEYYDRIFNEPGRETVKQKIIAVLNQKGGVGKTTTTINLAAFLAKKSARILIVDSDPQYNATSGLGVDNRGQKSNLADLLTGRSQKISECIMPTGVNNVDILPCDARLASAELDLAGMEEREYALKNVLQGDGGYDYVLIDCPPSLGLLTVNALVAADMVLIPVQAEYYALEGLSQLMQVMQQVRKGLNPELELLGVVMTMYDKRTSLSEQVYNEVSKHFGDKLFKTVIPRNVKLAEAPSFGKPISDHDRWSKGARAYKSLAKELKGRTDG